jgi:hypothetical protein
MASKEDDFEDDDESDIEDSIKRSPVKRFSGAHRGGKGHIMSIMAKLKKVHPAYWVLGLGGAALAVDYFVEGDQSVAASLYRGIFGASGHGHGHADAQHPAASHPTSAALPVASPASAAPAMAMQSALYGYPNYYPAYPYHYGHFDRHGFGHEHGGHGGHGGEHHAHVRGGYSWE